MIWKSLESTVIFFVKTAPLVITSIYIISHLNKRSYIRKLILKLTPLLRMLKLNPTAFTVFTLSFFNTIVAYSFLSNAWRDEKIKDRDVIAISLLSSFPSVFSHLYTFFIPFVIPILGSLGIIYTALRLIVALIKSLIGYMLVEKFEGEVKFESYESSVSENIVRILIVMFFTYLTVDLAYNIGLFNILTNSLKFLPIETPALMISILTIFNLRSAIVLTAGLVERGLSYKWALIGLLLGNVISFSVRSAKHSLPLHLSLFGSFGFKIVLLNSLLTLLLDVVIIFFLLLL